MYAPPVLQLLQICQRFSEIWKAMVSNLPCLHHVHVGSDRLPWRTLTNMIMIPARLRSLNQFANQQPAENVDVGMLDSARSPRLSPDSLTQGLSVRNQSQTPHSFSSPNRVYWSLSVPVEVTRKAGKDFNSQTARDCH